MEESLNANRTPPENQVGVTAAFPDTTYLKLIALASMLIDHVGAVFFPEVVAFRVIGRLAFPLYAYCIALGAWFTSNIKKYIARVLFTAIVSQPIYWLLFQNGCLNILFTFSLGLLSLHYVQEERYCAYALTLLAASLLPIEYGIPTLLLLVAFSMFLLDKRFILIAAFLLVFAYPFGLQTWAVLALPLLFLPIHIPLKVNRYLFYSFYPLHMLVLLFFRLFI